MRLRTIIRNIRDSYCAICMVRNWPEVVDRGVIKRQESTLILRNGLRIAGPDGNGALRMVWNIFHSGEYAPRGFEIGENDCVVDIGANIGIFTLFAARKTRNVVHAFEPFPGNFGYLRKNVLSNNYAHVSCHNRAVTDTLDPVKLCISKVSWGHRVFQGPSHKTPDGGFIEVPAITLKKIMDESDLEKIDYCKIDCEGAEGAILFSTPSSYLQRVRRIGLEFHDTVSSHSHQEISAMLEGLGFTVQKKWDGVSPFGHLFAKRTSGGGLV
jgi:FkbM family methyltransferase